MTHRQYGISALVTQMLFCKGLSGDLMRHRLFSQANNSNKWTDTFGTLLSVHLEKVSAYGMTKCSAITVSLPQMYV